MIRRNPLRLFRRTPPLQSMMKRLGTMCIGTEAATTARVSPTIVCSRRGQVDRPPTFSEVTEAVTVLGIDSPSRITEKELKAKYRELVKKHHPDAGGSEAMMSKITVAYDRITRMSKREKEEFDMQRRAFRGGSSAGNGAYSNGSRTYSGRSPYEASYKYNHDASSSDYYREEGQFSRAYSHRNQPPRSSYAPRGPSGLNTPFNYRDVFNWATNNAPRDIRRIPPSVLLFRMIVAYLFASIVFSIFYRKYRDWRQEEGWSQAETLARDEQREELMRVRQELAERIRMARDPTQIAARERAKELRALEYAQRRQVELQQQELRGWPAVDPSRGRIVRRPFEPVGIVYFEPMTNTAVASTSAAPVPPAIWSGSAVAER